MSESPKLNIGIAQLTSIDSVAENLKLIFNHLEKFSEQQLDVVCFPENSLYMRISSNSHGTQLRLDDEIFESLKHWSARHNCHILLGSLPLDVGASKPSNATVLIRPGTEPENVYEKIHLFNVDVEGQKPQRESDQFAAGRQATVIEINGWKIGLSICYDLRFSELYFEYAKQEVDLLFVPSAFLTTTGRAHWEVLLRARAIESQAYVVAPAQVGVHQSPAGQRESFGHSMIIDPWGSVVSDLKQEPGGQSCHLLEKDLIDKVRRQIPMKNHRRLKS